MKQPLISVIVPVYKVEKYLNKAVDSLLNQTYKNLEIILVDDGSPDRCPVICDEYARIDRRINVIHKQNGGLSDARNMALDVISGEYLTFVDSDDYIMKDAIEQMLNAMLDMEVDAVCCGLNYVNESGIIYDSNTIEKSFKSTGNSVVKLIIRDVYPQNFACGKLYKTSLWEGIKFPYGQLYEDIATIYKVIDKAKYVYCMSNCLYNYLNIREGNISSDLKGKRAARSYWYGCLNTSERFKYFEHKTEYIDIIPTLQRQMYTWSKLTVESAIPLGKTIYYEYCCKVSDILESTKIYVPLRLRLILCLRTLYYYIYPLIGRHQ